MNAVTELMSVHRQNNEAIDALMARFMPLRFRAQQGGGGVMSWAMHSWLLLRACGCNQSQLLTILQPTMGRFPNTEEEFNAMQISLRRMGHILEGAPLNLASQLRTPPAGNHGRQYVFGTENQGQDPQQPARTGAELPGRCATSRGTASRVESRAGRTPRPASREFGCMADTANGRRIRQRHRYSNGLVIRTQLGLCRV